MEVASLSAKVEAARKEWLSATDAQQKADLKEAFDFSKERLLDLDFRRAQLETRLSDIGDYIPLSRWQHDRI